jgi:hypothetical protein
VIGREVKETREGPEFLARIARDEQPGVHVQQLKKLCRREIVKGMDQRKIVGEKVDVECRQASNEGDGSDDANGYE